MLSKHLVRNEGHVKDTVYVMCFHGGPRKNYKCHWPYCELKRLFLVTMKWADLEDLLYSLPPNSLLQGLYIRNHSG